ncbi:DUF4214 domain-containing protein [Stutzerimonas kunmingensis]|uniref:DUF4214 domain-containing protein n=1 Tax=Stutzerimonas kunmingensis TaxID=1211807 RepID=UPI003AB5ABBA
MATASDLQQLYVGYFGRAADQEGLNFWLEAINNGGLSLDNVHASFVQSEEYAALYDGLSNSDLVTQVYLNVLGRGVEAEGLAFWAGALDAGTITQDQLIEGLLSGLSANDALIVQNKVTVANYYTTKVGASYGEADKALSADILDDVDATLGTVSAALGRVDLEASSEGTGPDALASALAMLEAAQNGQQTYATTLLGDLAAEDETDIATVDGLYGSAGTQYSTDIGALSAASTAVGGPSFIAADSAAVVAQKISEATTKAQAAVTAAQTALNTTVGPALVNSYNAALARFESAADAADAAGFNQTGAQAKFEAIDGNTYTINADGTATGLFALDGTTLVVAPAYASAATPTELAAANELLAVVQARVAADVAETNAKNALLTQAALVEAKDSGANADADGVIEDGLLGDLADAKADQAALAEAVADLADTNAIITEWAELVGAEADANDAITDLGYTIEEIADTGDYTVTGSDEVFVLDMVGFGNEASVTLDGDDVLFIGTGYSLGVDDATKGGLQGGNNALLEVFFVQNGGVVEAHIETVEFGSNAATQQTNVITLTGVTSLDGVTFDANTGFISLA